ncbi:thiaminase II [Natronobacterium gregoryi]|uniref:TenA family transcriptional activator n=2 Tax=Natronobacterium gregoryi TaxID=44930 RepID=L0ALM4_NATGS|nr:thiaminase II [Natronobacterium gregoryi]AFZ73955.1 putative transcription activator [Natronobacterium gregoryi SP2]ELY71709.1 TenA family transcriptional activator [Natronobacterium gregoryi SP2]PLK19535.1 thiaminase II [Natronobacterium gregoryi SP2]SFJ47206.1 thiaminase (transcriptional activator TenA) [Natronobacterium gregoryi]
MAFSDQLLEDGESVWEAQKRHPFVRELAAGSLDEEAFLTWVRQDYRYLLDYARVFAIGGAKARDEETMTHLLGVAHEILDFEMDLHREFAADYGIEPTDLETVQKSPTCVAYTNFLVRTAHEGSLAEIAAAIYPCGQGYLDIAEHIADNLEEEDNPYLPFVEKYTSDEFHEAVDWMRSFVDRCGERYPGEHEAMREAFLTSARLEHQFWEMAYTKEGWETTAIET